MQGRKTSQEVENKILEMYFGGEKNPNAIERLMGINPNVTRRIIKRSGKVPRNHRKGINSLPQEFTQLVSSLYWDYKLSARVIARRTGHSRRTVAKHLKSVGELRSLPEAIYMGRGSRPTEPEEYLIKVIERYNLPYRYTGNGSFFIGNINPDFVNVNGAKIALEVFGSYWHSPEMVATRPLRGEEERRKILRGYGWELLVLWTKDLKRMTEEEIINKIVGAIRE